MKEITTEMTVKVTFIQKVADKKADVVIAESNNVDLIKEKLGADDVRLIKTKNFVHDLPARKKKA